MAEPARARTENRAAPPDGYAPYGQIIKMLLPSVGCIAIYGADGELVWCSDGFERPDLRDLLERLRSGQGVSTGGGVSHTTSGMPAFVAPLNDDSGSALGSLVVELDRGNGRSPHSMIVSMLRPVLDCIATRLNLDRTMLSTERTETADFDLLVSVDDDDRDDPTALQQLLRNCVQHLGCSMGSLLLPDKNLAISAVLDKSLASSDLIDRTRKHLLAWAQLNNRPMVVNRMGKSGEVAPYKILSCPVRDVQGQVIGIVALFRAAEAEDFELRDIRIVEFVSRKSVAVLNSHYDALTGLVNRLIFERRTQKLLDAETPSDVSLLYIDIDKLAAFNESFGLTAGDEVIQRVGDVIRRASGPDATASRVGGDRFAVLLPDTQLTAACQLGQRILGATSQLAYMDGSDAVPVAVSIGVATMARRHERVRHLLAAAELACKDAKRQGRNRLAAGDTSEEMPIDRQLQAIAATNLQEGLKASDFGIEAQPIVALGARGGTLGFELLVRMREPGGQLLAPEKFFDAAERYELMPAVDRWVLCTAIEGLRPYKSKLTAALRCFALNVSAQSLASRSYIDFALEQIAAAGLPPSLFCFELKEVAAVNHVAAAEVFIRELTAAGCQVALDDFGCGLSSLAHLKRLPVHYLKIDGRLVRRLQSDRIAESMISGISRAASTLGISTIAEHVEDAATAARLRELDVQFGQGFHFGRPRPFAEIAASAASAAPRG
jgi:diguanylate cyclase (GGDEF)-like protein